ncbi:unnamed protein product [Paramecium sonneborni]|uniref:Uncharacterized protein n=1 Tax=Paramecium sonneborni TaxID=65129 RepID=A0A8S1MK20_9CILI|nr:unnamed protein product [Paramecium sonneborni]CAD8075418.1 unnamed protein product [Paramecium sonneborni]
MRYSEKIECQLHKDNLRLDKQNIEIAKNKVQFRNIIERVQI